jgi:kynurenine formamidase
LLCSIALLTSYLVWVDNGGVVGRGVLLDYASWAEAEGIKVLPLTTQSIPLADLKAVAKAQNVTFKPNDILFIRSGYVRALTSLSGAEGTEYAAQATEAIGVASGKEILQWIWEEQFAAVAGDMIAFEAVPFQSKEFSLHEWLLAGWGLPIGELFNLDKLAEECRKLGKWSFFFSSVPLNVSFSAKKRCFR